MTRKLATAIILSMTLTACGSTRTVNGFRSLAEFGAGFEGLTQKVMEQGLDRTIDSTSQDLIDAKPGAIAGNAAMLDSINNETVISIGHYDAIIAHAGLLSTYFGQLKILSEVDGETAVSESTDSIVTGLASVAGGLPEGISGAVGNLAGKLYVARHSKVLRRELEKHGDSIRRQLAIQTQALNFVRDRIAASERRINASQLGKSLTGEYADKKALPEDWAARRKAYLLARSRKALAATKAANLAARLETSFVALAEGRLEPEEMAVLTNELNRALAGLAPQN